MNYSRRVTVAAVAVNAIGTKCDLQFRHAVCRDNFARFRHLLLSVRHKISMSNFTVTPKYCIPSVVDKKVAVIMKANVEGIGTMGEIVHVDRSYFRYKLMNQSLALICNWENFDYAHSIGLLKTRPVLQEECGDEGAAEIALAEKFSGIPQQLHNLFGQKVEIFLDNKHIFKFGIDEEYELKILGYCHIKFPAKTIFALTKAISITDMESQLQDLATVKISHRENIILIGQDSYQYKCALLQNPITEKYLPQLQSIANVYTDNKPSQSPVSFDSTTNTIFILGDHKLRISVTVNDCQYQHDIPVTVIPKL